MKNKQILQILGVIASIIAIIFLVRDLNDAEKKARDIAEKTVNEMGVRGALNAMPYIASIGIYNNMNKYTDEEEFREVVIARYTEAEANYHDKYWINIFLIVVLCFVTFWLLSFFLDPSFRKNYPWQISVLLIGIACGIIFVKFDREKHADQFEKEKVSMMQKAKEREAVLQHVVDSLKSEIIYLHASNALDTAENLSDLGFITDMLLKHETDADDFFGIIDQHHPDIRARLFKLGQRFFNSEVRAISSTEEFKKFEKDLSSAERIVPVFCMNVNTHYELYWEKSSKFGR